MLLLVTFSSVGFIILLLCYLVKYRKLANLIAGYDEDKVADKDGLCNWIGSVIAFPGIGAIITGVLLWQKPEWGTVIVLLFGSVTVVACILATAGGRKFMKRD